MFSKKIQVVTHAGSFHSDDVFAAATLHLYFQKTKKSHQLIRTLDPKTIEKADIVFDIGGIYDQETNRFDHHQKGGAGERLNGIPYAAFGLVWKKYGPLLCGSQDIADEIDRTLVQAMDAADNGVSISNNLHSEALPVFVQDLISSFNTSFEEKHISTDVRFDEAMSIAILYLTRVIHLAKVQEKINTKVDELYQQGNTQSIVVVDLPYGRIPLSIAANRIPEILYIVYPSSRGDNWDVCASRVSMDSFESKKPFPESWRGLKDEKLEEVSGIPGVIFCHNSGFLCATKTKESAILLAKKALTA